MSKRASSLSVGLVLPEETIGIGRGMDPQTPPLGIVLKQNIKDLQLWFCIWHKWQKRIAICRIIDHCPTPHMKSLATSLEPILHLDFSSSLAPLMAALHQETTNTFKIHRKSNPKHTDSSLADSYLFPRSVSLYSKALQSAQQSIKKPVFLPSMPRLHLQHKSSPAFSDNGDSTTDDLHLPPLAQQRRNLIEADSQAMHLKKMRLRAHGRKHLTLRHRQNKPETELFKYQLELISKWMRECSPADMSHLLLELVKLCDKELLGYLVQCLYQALHMNRGIDCLSDALIVEVFSYLSPQNLCKCARVSRRWQRLSSLALLWKHHCTVFSLREGLGNLTAAVEAVHTIASLRRQQTSGNSVANLQDIKDISSLVVDWKLTYRDLSKLTGKLKDFAIRAAELRADKLKIKDVSKPEQSLDQIKASLTLREMLDIIRTNEKLDPSDSTTRDLVQSAPESAISKRRKARAEREANEQLELERRNKYDDYYNVAGTGLLEDVDYHTTLSNEKLMIKKKEAKEFLGVAIDSRPGVPSLPNPEGIEALVLAGFLSPKDRLHVGKPETIPILQRLTSGDVTVLCVQCDERKIVAGCSDRKIHIYDIRSGRLVAVLVGHKGSVQCLQFDEHKIVSGSWDTTCIVWDIVNHTTIKILAGHIDCISALKFNEKILITGSYDCSIRIWETLSWNCIQTIASAHKRPIRCLAYNGQTLVSGCENKVVKLWNVGEGVSLASLDHPSWVTCLSLSKLLLVTACGDGSVHLWDMFRRVKITECRLNYNTDMAHVTNMILEKGKLLAAASDALLHEWDIGTGASTRTLLGHTSALTAVWAGNHKLVTASEDETMCVWTAKKTTRKDDNRHHHQRKDSDTFFTPVPIRTITTHKR